MERDYYVKLEDSIILKHFDEKTHVPDVVAIQAELKENGYERSEESIKTHIYNMRRNGKAPKSTRCVYPQKVICCETGRTFESIGAAKRWIGINSYDAISSALLDRRRTAGGYHWKYARK